jgi:hypothetical protein
VELAITLGLAFFFFMAAIEMCRAAMIRHTVDNALYEGARAGIIPGATATEVENETRRILRSLRLVQADVTVSPVNIQTTTPFVEVTIRVPFDQNLFAAAVFFRNAVYERSFRMQREIPRGLN